MNLGFGIGVIYRYICMRLRVEQGFGIGIILKPLLKSSYRTHGLLVNRYDIDSSSYSHTYDRPRQGQFSQSLEGGSLRWVRHALSGEDCALGSMTINDKSCHDP